MRDRNIYLLYSCNEWKEYASMRLVMASTSTEKILRAIKKEIRNDRMGFENEELSKRKQLNLFKECLDEYGEDVYKINDCLEYGCIMVVGDGEEQ